MYFYVAYGLGIHSTLPLPELVSVSEVEADVVIRRGKIGCPPSEGDCTGHYFHMTAEEAYLFWEGEGGFLVRNGKEIIVDPLPGVEARLTRLPLLGVVLGTLLQQRGFLGLHASAIALDGGAVAFLGGVGWGKSTMAASLYARGHRLVADDLVALDLDSPGRPMVLPGFPQFKLFPEAAASALGDDPEVLPRLATGFEKRARKVHTGFSQQPLPLRHIYVLSEGPTPKIEPLQPQEAIVHLISHSYAAGILKRFLQGAKAASHFLQCAEIARNVPIYYLKRPRSLSLLAELARLVETHSSKREVTVGE